MSNVIVVDFKPRPRQIVQHDPRWSFFDDIGQDPDLDRAVREYIHALNRSIDETERRFNAIMPEGSR